MTTRILAKPSPAPAPPAPKANAAIPQRQPPFVDFRQRDDLKSALRDAFQIVPRPPKLPELDADALKRLKTALAPLTREGALQNMEPLLRGTPKEAVDPGLGTTVLYDAPDVNASQDTQDTSARHVAAERQVEANAALEQEALGAMSEGDRAAYQAVKQGCLAQNDPVAALALQRLLFTGALPGDADLVGEGNLLQHLTGLADGSTPLADGVDRRQLLTDLVQELANPAAVDQGYRGTCAPTAVAIQLAITHPAEYARVMLGLSSPKGEVTMPGGMVFKREPDVSFAPDTTGRALTQRIMAPTFMEIANGAGNYHDATGAGEGAWSDTLDRLSEQVFGQPMSESRLTTPDARAHAMQIVDAELAAGNDVPVALHYGTGLHKVLITGMETVDGVEYVKLINPWGREERIARDDFQGRLVDINYDPTAPGVDTPAPALQRLAEAAATHLDWFKLSPSA